MSSSDLDALKARRAQLIAEQSGLEQAREQNAQEIQRLRSRADGLGGKKLDAELTSRMGRQSQLDQQVMANRGRLAQNQQQLNDVAVRDALDRTGVESPPKESELTYAKGSPHKDWEEFKKIKEAQLQQERTRSAQTAEGALDGVDQTLKAKDRSPAVDPKMDQHFYAKHGGHAYTDTQPRAGSAYDPKNQQRSRDRGAGETSKQKPESEPER